MQKIYNARNLFTDLSLLGWEKISIAKRIPCRIPNPQISKRILSEIEARGILTKVIHC